MEYATLPILSMSQQTQMDWLLLRMERDNAGCVSLARVCVLSVHQCVVLALSNTCAVCSLSGKIHLDSSGQISAITVTCALTGCTAPVTGITPRVPLPGMRVEHYGPDTTTWVTLQAGQTVTITPAF